MEAKVVTDISQERKFFQNKQVVFHDKRSLVVVVITNKLKYKLRSCGNSLLMLPLYQNNLNYLLATPAEYLKYFEWKDKPVPQK